MSERPELWIEDGDWQQYEAYVLGALQRRFLGAEIRRNVFLPGLKSGKPRQIDVLVKTTVGGLDFTIVFDCKFYQKNVDVNDVEAFLGMLDDIRVTKGVLVTAKGFSSGARERIEREPREVDLQILSPERLSEYQHIGCAVLWKGPVAAVVGPLQGWVVDNEKTGEEGHPQFSMYPLGHTNESARRFMPYIYGNIVLKNDAEPTMEAIAKRHEETVLDKRPNARFERLSVTPELGHPPEKILFRVGMIDSSYFGPEYSIYIDHDDGVLLLVLLCPQGKDDEFLPMMKLLAREAFFMTKVPEIAGKE